MESCEILIVGAGAAGIAAAKAAYQAGCRSIVMADRKAEPGGILLQCAHSGFGAQLTGPEYAEKLLRDFPEEILFYPNCTVLSIGDDKTAVLSGGRRVRFRQMILAAGCREIPAGALNIAGTRPRGVYTAGQMQEMMNLHGHIPEGPAVILGSGDLGLIMAGQLAESGLAVTMVEQRAACGGLAKNQRRLLEYPIRLICNSTITEIFGERQLEGVVTSDGTFLSCRTLLIAAGLRPERELLRGLNNPDWLWLCGNCSRVHAMVEAVVSEGEQAGIAAWDKIRGDL